MTDMTNNVDHMTGKTNDETVTTIPMTETTQDVTVTTVINGRIFENMTTFLNKS